MKVNIISTRVWALGTILEKKTIGIENLGNDWDCSENDADETGNNT